MTDITLPPGADGKLISLDDEKEVLYWAHILGCTEDELRAAVHVVGHDANAVRQHLTVLAAAHNPSSE
jgi:hypothetical protein